MAGFSGQWPPGSLTSLHSSNPEPFIWPELSDLVDTDLIEQISQSPLHYESTQGRPAVREAIAGHLYETVNAAQVILTSGAQEGIFLTMQALLSEGDEVIGFIPCFEPLLTVATETGARVTTIELTASSGWGIDWDQLEATINGQTRLLVVNFPHNPTGSQLSHDDWQRLLDLCQAHDCWLFADEVFRGLEHDPSDRLRPAVDGYAKAISMGVTSKSLALPGVRLGWLTCRDAELVQRILTIKSHLSICQSSLDATLFEQLIPISERIWQRNTQLINTNKQQLANWLADKTDFHWQEPTASATGFVQLSSGSAKHYAKQLAEQQGLLVMPGLAFMTDIEGFRVTLGMAQPFDWTRLRIS
jgi:aspartate/methionine/tyrosine aminotransferase